VSPQNPADLTRRLVVQGLGISAAGAALPGIAVKNSATLTGGSGKEAIAYTLPGIVAHESSLRGGEVLKIRHCGTAAT
jgi:hypothetical protein